MCAGSFWNPNNSVPHATSLTRDIRDDDRFAFGIVLLHLNEPVNLFVWSHRKPAVGGIHTDKKTKQRLLASVKKWLLVAFERSES